MNINIHSSYERSLAFISKRCPNVLVDYMMPYCKPSFFRLQVLARSGVLFFIAKTRLPESNDDEQRREAIAYPGPARGYGQVGPWPDLKKFQNITRLLDRLDSGLSQANETFC